MALEAAQQGPLIPFALHYHEHERGNGAWRTDVGGTDGTNGTYEGVGECSHVQLLDQVSYQELGGGVFASSIALRVALPEEA
jgi:hypothetical protein